jgi:dolichol kinase
VHELPEGVAEAREDRSVGVGGGLRMRLRNAMQVGGLIVGGGIVLLIFLSIAIVLSPLGFLFGFVAMLRWYGLL